MSKYRKKPVVIEAFQLGQAAPSWLNDAIGTGGVTVHATFEAPTTLAYALIRTLEGEMRANLGDWIIRGVKGELYPCKPDIFAEIYDPETPNV